MKKLGFWFFAFVLISACNSAEKPAEKKETWTPGQTKIENGLIEGIVDEQSGLQIFKGIPFAKPPVGELRWKAPQPADNWEGVKMTKEFGNSSTQAKIWDDLIPRAPATGEDCLYLNVWTPATAETKDLPVLVYFFGGGFMAGDGSEARYDGASMAQKGIVSVTINYRLNVFGFMAHPELSAEAPYKASGNYGLLDQNAALQWVQKNIAAFGGDPKKVTIAGESAGSFSVSMQMASPLSKDLIAGAIGESGAAISVPATLEEAEKIGLDFAKEMGDLSLAELRALPTEKIYEAYQAMNGFRFPTVQDGYFYPKSLPEIFEAKQQAQVPLLLGWTSAEMPGAAFMGGMDFSEKKYIQKVKEAYPDNANEVLKLYPHGSEEEIIASSTALGSDRFIGYGTWKWFDLHRKNSTQPVYRYLFSKLRPHLRSVADTLAADAPKTPPALGAPHASDIEYCLGNLDLRKDYWAWTPDDYKTAETFQGFLANFIKTGNPNGTGLPDWPAAKADDPNPPYMNIDTNSKTELAKHDDRYLLLDKVKGFTKL